MRKLRFRRGWGSLFLSLFVFFSLSTQLFAQWEERRKRKQKLASKANWPKVESKTQNYFFSSAANTHTHRHTYSFGCMYVCSQQALRREGKSRAGKESCLRLRRRLLTVTATAGHNGHTHTHKRCNGDFFHSHSQCSPKRNKQTVTERMKEREREKERIARFRLLLPGRQHNY